MENKFLMLNAKLRVLNNNSNHCGGIVGGLRFIPMFGACSFGRGPVGGIRPGCSGSFKLGG